MTAGKPRNRDEYNELTVDNIKVYVAHSVNADEVSITYRRGLFGGLRVVFS